MINIPKEIQEKLIKLRYEERRTKSSLCDEFGYSKGVMYRFFKKYEEQLSENKKEKAEHDKSIELGKLKAEIQELKKENDFLKKAAAFFAKIDK